MVLPPNGTVSACRSFLKVNAGTSEVELKVLLWRMQEGGLERASGYLTYLITWPSGTLQLSPCCFNYLLASFFG